MSAAVAARIYWVVFAILIACTILTVGQSRLEVGHGFNISLGLVIAACKATLVALFFMHLRHEKKYFYGVIIFPLVLVMIILFSNFPDVAYGDLTTPAELIQHGTGH